MGLTICQKLVLLHQGQIRIECQSGKGTLVILTLTKKLDER